MHRLKFYLFIVVCQQESVILCYNQSAQFCLGCFYSQFLKQWCTNSFEQQVTPTLCPQLLHKFFYFLGSLLWAAMLVCAVISLIMIFVEPGAKWIAITAVCVAVPVLALLLLCKKPAEQA